MERASRELYFDPFAGEGEELFDARESFQEILARYQNDEIAHDDKADNFVRETEALMLDAQFTGQFEAFQDIAAQMHALCQSDHMLRESMVGNTLWDDSASHDKNDGHHHEDEELKKKDAKAKKREKASRPFPKGWMQLLLEYLPKRTGKAKS